jgi:hypothetical protein
VFGKDPRDEEIFWLRSQVKFLQEQLVMIADQSAAARLLPRPERRDATGKARSSHRFLEDRPNGTTSELAQIAAENAAAVERSFVDTRQP